MKKDPNRTIEYYLNNTKVKRRVGRRTSLPTVKEKSAQAAFKMAGSFLSHIKKFIRIGYQIEASRKSQLPYNLAKSYNYNVIIQGEYPNQEINYAKAILSIGGMPLAPNMRAEIDPTGIKFSWDPALPEAGCDPGDQVMLMAYFPAKSYGIQILNGNKRFTGEHLLELPGSALPVEVHVYMSFIAADHYSISNSTYLGQFIWHKP